jgi:hypothetical protein
LDVDHKSQDYYYGPDGTDAPEYIPGHIFRSTNAPGYWSHYNDHGGIPNMLTPPQNPMLTGTVCVVKGSVDVGDPIPHQEGDPAVAISYGVAPAETMLASEADAIVVEVYYPGYENFKKRWEFSGAQGLSGSISWDGLLDLYDDYGNLFASNVGYCPCSTVFARITVKVRDRYWTIYGIQEPIREWTWEMPRISIVWPHWDSLFLVTDPAEMILLASPSVTAPVADAQWSGGEDPPSGSGSSFTTAFRMRLDEQWIVAVLEGLTTLQKLFSSGIEKVEWIQLQDGGQLENGPGEGEQSIFPDWTWDDVNNTPEEDRPKRQRIAIKATLKKAVPYVPVYFRVIDVDDPSTSVAPVDANDSNGDDDEDGSPIDGLDNKGGHNWADAAVQEQLGLGTGYSLVGGTASKFTDLNGVCSVILEVSLSPGDNYRAVASLANPLAVKSGTVGDGPPTVYYNYEGNRRFFPDWPDRFTWATDNYLTVWRRFYVECDSMSAIPESSNWVAGTVQVVISEDGNRRVFIQRGSGDEVHVTDRFVPGAMWDEIRKYEVLSNTSGESFQVLISGTLAPSVGALVYLYDDDFNLNTSQPSYANQLPATPDVSLAASAMERAYIKVDTVNDWNDSTKNPEPYFPQSPPREYRANDTKGHPMFWIGYVLSAFQEHWNSCRDPNTQTDVTVGIGPSDPEKGSVVYTETIRDAGVGSFGSQITAHELGHHFSHVQHAKKDGSIATIESPSIYYITGNILSEDGLIIGTEEGARSIVCFKTAGGATIASAYLVAYENIGNLCKLTLDQPLSGLEQGYGCEIYSRSIMAPAVGQGNIFCAATLDRLRRQIGSPLK